MATYTAIQIALGHREAVDGIIAGVPTLGLFVFIVMAPLVLIAHAALCALKRPAWFYYVGLAAVVGYFLGSLVTYVESSISRLWMDGGFAIWAAVCVAIFWLIRRPDKDAVVPLDTHF
ncbi:hypothetical protein ABAC460_08275 [Asticcacaulis sp. AC460]|uniref:hypothetical protein n=1 Tax=Asticcacaulis sp. AC460 TaxID=1282360 RepID=UPI0003C3EC5C|nr:hypothetical protein [Asticcacaulis sp. AC460]ESQ90815.1 hypothetical protein ABAC460_08275 [Asticcacaulis sp. AC460]